MIFQVLLLIFLLGGTVLGGITAYRRPLLERVILLLTIPLAWVAALLLLSGGVLDFAGTMLVDLIAGLTDAGELLAGPAVSSGAAALINTLVRLLVMAPVFLLLLLLLRIIYAIVMAATGARAKCKLFMSGQKNEVVKNLAISLIGAVGGFAICMLLLLPIHALSGLLAPTVETFADEKYNGTYVSAQADMVDSNLLPLSKQTPCGTVQTFTGMRAIMDASTHQLCNVSLVNEAGHTLSFNTHTLLTTLIKDGAIGVTLYEYSCNPQKHTLGDFALAADVIDDLADQEILLSMAQELLASVNTEAAPAAQQEDEKDSALTEMLASLAASYKDADAQILQSDIHAVAELLRVVTTDLSDVSMKDTQLQTLLFDYLADEEATYRVVNALSKVHVYGQVLSSLTEYGMNMLGDMLDISQDRQAHHSKYVLALQQALNDRSIGSYELSAVETFIRHVAQAKLTVNDPSLQTELPVQIHSAYERYMARSKAVLSVLDSYTDNGSGKPYFVGADGQVYIYDEIAGTWTEAGSDGALDRGSYLVQALLEQVNRILDENADAVLDHPAMLTCVDAVAAQLVSSDAAYASGCLRLASTVSDMEAEAFAKGAVFRRDLVDSLKTDISFGEAENRQFASIVHTAAELFTQLPDNEDASLDAIMGQFAGVGKLLDGFTQFEMTSDVSSLLLQSLMQNSQYGAYFSAESVQDLIENVKDGSTTYEQLFRSVQSLYNILNQINPLSPAA